MSVICWISDYIFSGWDNLPWANESISLEEEEEEEHPGPPPI